MEKIDEIISLIDSHEKKETRSVFLKYIKQWHWFLIISFVGLVAGYFYFINSPSTYRVSSRILVNNQDNNMNNVLAFSQQSAQLRAQDINIENQIGILHSYTLYERAIANLNWDYSWFHKRLLYNKELYEDSPMKLTIPPNAINVKDVFIEITPQNNQEYVLVTEGKTELNGNEEFFEFEEHLAFGTPFVNQFFNFTIDSLYGIPEETYLLKFNSTHVLTTEYLERAQIELTDINSDIISITIEGADPQKDAEFINELNEVFIQFGMENESITSEKSVQFIEEQLSSIKSSLESSEEEFSNYRQNNRVVNLSQEAQLIYQTLEEIENDQYLTQLQLDYYRDLEQHIDDSEEIEEMLNPSVVGIDDQSLNGLLNRLRDSYTRREELSFSVQEDNPRLVMLEQDIRSIRESLEETLRSQLQITESKMNSLNERYNQVQERLARLPETEQEVVRLERDFNLNNELYTYMQQKRAEASIAQASIAPKVRVIDPALAASATHIGPSIIKNVGIGAGAGLALTFMVITLIGFFNTKIESRDEIEKLSKLPVLEGIIKHKYKSLLPVLKHPRSGIAESFRGLKSNLNAILEQPGPKVVSINSLVPGEGKSFVSSNFSAILTKTTNKVLLIGADLHKPTLHKFLGVEESFGLSNYLAGEKEINDIVKPTPITNLFFIQAGPISQSPSDLIENSKFEHLIETTKKKFDYVIIDNAPLLLVPDSVLTSRFSDVSLFVVRINHSHKEQIKQINKLTEFNKIKKAAIVVNGAPDRGYGYGKKYWKKGYGEYKQKMSIA